jgi:hypothetical protein
MRAKKERCKERERMRGDRGLTILVIVNISYTRKEMENLMERNSRKCRERKEIGGRKAWEHCWSYYEHLLFKRRI